VHVRQRLEAVVVAAAVDGGVEGLHAGHDAEQRDSWDLRAISSGSARCGSSRSGSSSDDGVMMKMVAAVFDQQALCADRGAVSRENHAQLLLAPCVGGPRPWASRPRLHRPTGR
jgi:hypothetical protein